ncbi:hypothetical protein FQN54_002010 [Arachnomyces sp. PD_36]|nr:hypothetical protein FQN54_002010 [Arachnomyces sp. PD_36]
MGDKQPPSVKPSAEDPLLKEIKDYYSKSTKRPDLFSKFQNIDLDRNLPAAKEYFSNPSTKNFVVDFGEEHAWCAPNLEEEDYEALLKAERPSCFGTRWINIWGPELQIPSLRAITEHYGLSARLQKMMMTKPKNPPTPKPDQGSWSGAANEDDSDDEVEERSTHDIEEGLYLKPTSTWDDAKKKIGLGDLSFSDIVNDIWHFSSVDYGQRYLCMGYNSIYSVPEVHFHDNPNLPDSKRIWCWIILCDDGTVISIQENPFPQLLTTSGREPKETHSAEEKAKTLKIIRRNIGIVFMGISNAPGAKEKTADSLMSMRVRDFVVKKGKTASTNSNECASLLFYAIFDDWLTIYNVIAKREQPYGADLEALRKSMLLQAELRLIDRLHQLGNQLGVLKRIYKTYELTVNRLLLHQQRMRGGSRANGSTADLQLLRDGGDLDDLTPLMDVAGDATVGIQLSASAIVRFERLADRIRLYALGEIEECLTQKESLTFLNFNLIALKDSQAVEKLTRITILLAKATILFLPVSLMTAYFSTEIPELQNAYTAKTYWVCFAVILVLSVVVLWIFGRASGTVEGKTIYQSLSKTFFDASRGAIGKGKKKARRRKSRTQ